MASGPQLSIVIPAFNEERSLGLLFSDIAALAITHEVIVVDGGSTDGTRQIARAAGARLLCSAVGRGVQLRAGADEAVAPVLLFIHADVRLDHEARGVLEQGAVASRTGALAFRLRIDAFGFSYRLIEWGTNLRSRLFTLPYGDQALLVRHDDYVRVGGYPEIPLMEDVALVRELRGITHVRLANAAVRVSPRRWKADGPIRRTLKNWLLLARYLVGTAPERLARDYRPEAVSDG